MAKGLKFGFISLVVLLSCSQPKKENLIIGKWVYHHTENGGREDFAIDSLKYTAYPNGSIIQFSKNDSVEFFQPQYGTRNANYRLLQQGSLLIVNHPKDNGADTSKIELTNQTLKIFADRLVLVFNKQQ